MRVVVSLENRFYRTRSSEILSKTGLAYRFWRRYLDVFDEVKVLARVHEHFVPEEDGWERADGPGVTFAVLPPYRGPKEYLLQFATIRRTIRDTYSSEDALIMRVPSPIAAVLIPKDKKPFGLEVLGDPLDAYSAGAVRHPLRPFFRWWLAHQMREQCARASAVAYVTQYVLQARYPASSAAFTTNYSTVELPATVLRSSPRSPEPKLEYSIVTVGSLEQMYKGIDTLIDAVGICSARGIELSLAIVGDGRHRRELEARARSLGLEGKIQFLGQLAAGEAVLNRLDNADLFVLASRSEGLPRAMIEAMARGLPCIGTAVGGIPELLGPESLVPPDNPPALASKIVDVLADPTRMGGMSTENLARAAMFRDDLLRERRIQLYRYLRRETSTWLSG